MPALKPDFMETPAQRAIKVDETLDLDSLPEKSNISDSHIDEDKCYKCHECSYACDSIGDIIEHMKIHPGGKPYKCDECSFAVLSGHDRFAQLRLDFFFFCFWSCSSSRKRSSRCATITAPGRFMKSAQMARTCAK